MTVPITVFSQADSGASSGVDVLDRLVSSGLTGPNGKSVRVPVLAEASPSLENGLWKLLPNRRMETTWTIREGASLARWDAADD